jgi:hypothetical protein
MNNKSYYDVKVEFLIPTTITYRVSATNEHEALKEVEKISAQKKSQQQHLNRKIKLKATVYNPSSSMIKLSKIYRNI